jgi:putative spermidine/putrescine transport system permease protein
VLAASYGIDQRIEHAAISLGANSFVTFRRVTLPLIMPGVVSGWVLAFINSFDEVTMTVFIASPSTTTLPVRLFLYIQDNIDPLVCSISASLILMTAVVMIVLDRLFGLDRLFLGSAKS